jgi:hypothetical protein
MHNVNIFHFIEGKLMFREFILNHLSNNLYQGFNDKAIKA